MPSNVLPSDGKRSGFAGSGEHFFDVVAVIILFFVAKTAVDLETFGLSLGDLLGKEREKIRLSQSDQGAGRALTAAVTFVFNLQFVKDVKRNVHKRNQ